MKTTDSKCTGQHALLTLPNDPELLPLALDLVRRMARRHELGHRPTQELVLAVCEAVDNVCRHAFRPGDKASFNVGVHPVPGGLEVRVRDKGLPYEPEMDDPEKTQRGLALMAQNTDNLQFLNLGHLGKEVRLLKLAARTNLWQEVEAPAFEPESFSKEQLVVRRMRAEDAIEVSRCFYDVYGYEYGDDKVYEPHRLAQLNDQGLLLTIVAVTPEGYVLGTESLERPNSETKIYEAGMAAVRPEAQHFGVGGAMGRYMYKLLAEEKIAGVWAACVTSHTHSQRTVPPGSQACLLAPGNKQPDHTVKPPQAQRNSVLYVYQDLNPTPPTPTLYLPPQHKDICQKILRGFGWEPDYKEPNGEAPQGQTRAAYDINTARGRVLGRVTKYGADFAEGGRQKHNFFRTHGYDALYAFLPLTDSYTVEAVNLLESWNYFFCGIFPGSGLNDPYLAMVYLNNQILDYDQIHILDPFALELRDHIRDLDPEQKPL
jgi:anti-sigma regulatory factor (Ser/Thr protein kinase)